MKFEDDISLNIHNFRIHGILIPGFKCKICCKIFPRKSVLQEHKLRSHKQIQEYSNDTMESKQDDEIRCEKTIKDERKEHKCEICGKIFEFKELLDKHFQSDHENHLDVQHITPEQKNPGENQKLPCEKCNKFFSCKAYLRKHYKTLLHKEQHSVRHKELQEKAVCEMCKKTFFRKDRLKRHLLNIHGENQNFPCETCGKVFKCKKYLNRHYNSQHKEKAVCEKQKLPCETCGKLFACKRYLKTHYNFQHKEQQEKAVCLMCEKTFINNLKLNQHIKSVHREVGASGMFQCDFCDTTFGENHKLKKHIDNHHKRVARQVARQVAEICDICQKYFSSNIKLKDHILKIHEGKFIKCDICQKDLSSNRRLKDHVKAVHNKSSQDIYECEFCDQ